MDDYKSYLAACILSEDRVITYRVLSRALKIHVNVAKEMLYEFHRQQNGKKPGTIHATYLISGKKRKSESTTTNCGPKKDGEDEYMQSSPFMSSSMPQVEDTTVECSVLSISLAKEEDLDNLRSEYEHVSSIHIYSLGPHPLKDPQQLSDTTRELQDTYAGEDPLESGATYGTITNKNVRRRAGRRPPLAPAAAMVKSLPAKLKTDNAIGTPQSSGSKQETKVAQPSSAKDFFGKGISKMESAGTKSEKKALTSTPTLKRDTPSIFKSFAKAKPKLQREGTDSSTAASPNDSTVPSPLEDQSMKDVSDDEEDNYVPPPQPASKSIVHSDRKSREEREAALRQMMEDSEDEPVAVLDNEDGEELKSEQPAKVGEETSIVSDGRKRGKRRVMKKKTFKDEEGYLVTKEEPVWESFSEDEPAAPKSKAQPSSFTAKPKKAIGKAGQGSIMSFFGKK